MSFFENVLAGVQQESDGVVASHLHVRGTSECILGITSTSRVVTIGIVLNLSHNVFDTGKLGVYIPANGQVYRARDKQKG